MDNPESRISAFLEGISFKDLPGSVIHEAKRALLDTLGCIIAGVDTPLGRRLSSLCARFVDSNGSTVVGVKKRAAPFFGAMCNSYMANAHDADDGHRMSRLHAGGVIIPVAMAMAEDTVCDGPRFVESMVIGYELGLRAGMASTEGETYYGSAFGSTFGAAAAAAYLLGLSNEGIVQAMGIGEMQAPNCMLMGWINSRRIPMVKEGMGWSAASGIMSAYMAEQGIRGTLAIFDSGDKTIRIDQLGRVYEIEKRYYKPHPGCRWSHGPGQTLTAMVAENKLSTGDIETIEVATFEKAAQLDNPAPATMDEAEYSIPFILGAILADGCFGPDQMTRAKLSDPRILKQARKVRLKVKSEFDGKYPAQALADVKLTTREGLEFRAKSERSRGDWDYPLSDVQLEDKFRLMCANRLSRDHAGTIIDRIWSLEAEPGVRDFIAWINQLVCRH
jgi:2-methylcitrate dehydratase PrpD